MKELKEKILEILEGECGDMSLVEYRELLECLKDEIEMRLDAVNEELE